MSKDEMSKLDLLFEKVNEIHLMCTDGFSSLNTWKDEHEKRHERDDDRNTNSKKETMNWTRWAGPFLLSIFVFCWTIFKK